jgi:hypothetical protein
MGFCAKKVLRIDYFSFHYPISTTIPHISPIYLYTGIIYLWINLWISVRKCRYLVCLWTTHLIYFIEYMILYMSYYVFCWYRGEAIHTPIPRDKSLAFIFSNPNNKFTMTCISACGHMTKVIWNTCTWCIGTHNVMHHAFPNAISDAYL